MIIHEYKILSNSTLHVYRGLRFDVPEKPKSGDFGVLWTLTIGFHFDRTELDYSFTREKIRYSKKDGWQKKHVFDYQIYSPELTTASIPEGKLPSSDRRILREVWKEFISRIEEMKDLTLLQLLTLMKLRDRQR